MSAAAVTATLQVQHKKLESFLEKHFVTIAFAVSTLAMLVLSPLHLFLGAAIGFAINYFADSALKLKPGDRIITLPNALAAIIGATASLITLTPAASGGGALFKAIPFLCALTVGSTAYRAFKSF